MTKIEDNKLYEKLKYTGKEEELDELDVFIAEEILKLKK
jgi:hypothetical protein